MHTSGIPTTKNLQQTFSDGRTQKMRRALGHVSLTVHATKVGGSSPSGEQARGPGSLCVHGNGDRTLIGTFAGTTTLGGTSLIASGGLRNVFVLTTNAGGVVKWAMRLGVVLTNHADTQAVVCGSSGSVFVTGFADGSGSSTDNI